MEEQKIPVEKIKNEIIYEIFLLRQEQARLNSIRTNLLNLRSHKILMTIFKFFNRKDLENIQKESAIERLGSAIQDLGDCLNDVETLKQKFEKFCGSNDKESYIGKTIKASKKERKNKITLIVSGIILTALSIALISVSSGAAIPFIVSTLCLSAPISFTALGSVHNDRKSIITEKLSHGIKLNWFEKTFYPKHIKTVNQKLEEEKNTRLNNTQSTQPSQSLIPQQNLDSQESNDISKPLSLLQQKTHGSSKSKNNRSSKPKKYPPR